MDGKKKILAQLFVEALEAYKNYDTIQDAVYLMSDGVKDGWEDFYETFAEVFGVSYTEAKKLRLF